MHMYLLFNPHNKKHTWTTSKSTF